MFFVGVSSKAVCPLGCMPLHMNGREAACQVCTHTVEAREDKRLKSKHWCCCMFGIQTRTHAHTHTHMHTFTEYLCCLMMMVVVVMMVAIHAVRVYLEAKTHTLHVLSLPLCLLSQLPSNGCIVF